MLTIQEAIEAYATIARSEFKSEKTIAWVETSARSFERFVGADVAVGDLGMEHVRGWIAALRIQPRYADHPFAKRTTATVSPIAINTYVRGLKLLITTLVRSDVLRGHPLERIRPPKAPQLTIQPYSHEQMHAILEAVSTGMNPLRDRAMVALSLDSCLRRSELLGLSGGDVDLQGRQLTVMGKGQKQRVVPFGVWANDQLTAYLRAERPSGSASYIWLTRNGLPLTVGGWQQVLRRVSRRVGWRVNAHAFRHTGAVMYVRNGGDPFRLQLLLGHSDLAMTRRYCAIADSDLRAVHKMASPGDRLAFPEGSWPGAPQ